MAQEKEVMTLGENMISSFVQWWK